MAQRFKIGDRVRLVGGGSYMIFDGKHKMTAHWDTQTAPYGHIRQARPRRGRATDYEVEPIAPGFGVFNLQARNLQRVVPDQAEVKT